MKFGVFLLLFTVTISVAQEKIGFKVKDSLNNPISDAYVFLSNKVKVTNNEGEVYFTAQKGKVYLKIKHVSYQEISKFIEVGKDSFIVFTLKPSEQILQEVVVTAKESNGIASSSVIDKRAMSHLQPTSFTDLVSLLPGENNRQTSLSVSNHLRLRETGTANSDYATSSLGVSFLVDGVPVNTNANMQQTVGYDLLVNPGSDGANGSRNTIRKGVDMRSISTDEIEKVEIVRGVASAKYGDLSSGLVKIQRKNGYTPWKARIKSDGYSKLYYLGKGYDFSKNNLKVNFDVTVLDAQIDPRNDFENYKRYTTSLRLEKFFDSDTPITWNLNVDYTGTIDDERTNPDVAFDKYESYKSTYNSVRLSNQFNIAFSKGILNNINFKASVSQSFDKIKQTKWVQLTSAKAIPVPNESGEGYGIFLPASYVSKQTIDGKPLDVFLDASGVLDFNLFKANNTITFGVNYNFSKNNGLGQVYDPLLPPSGVLTRPRAFKDIPAMQSLAFYAENVIQWNVDKTKFTFSTGLRATSLLGLNSKYVIGNDFFFDPRINAKIAFPKIKFNNGKELAASLTLGYGKHNKLPTQNMLYPQEQYVDFEQLNYYHNNKDFRQVHYKTYALPRVNYNIKPALNTKKEVRFGVNYDHHSLYVTYFKEKMNSGFRNVSDYHLLTFNKYDTSGIDANTITAAPLIEDLPFVTESNLVLASQESNGSAIYKTGIELQYATKRIKALQTRFTVNGAWLKSQYFNAIPFYRSVSEFIAGKREVNVGLYESDDNTYNERKQTSIIADTYLNSLGLTTSFRVDVNWAGKRSFYPDSRVPTHYVNDNGDLVPYTSVEANDPVLQSLILDGRGASSVDIRRTPLYLNSHIKISKKFYKYFTVSMYVNNLFNYYERNNVGNGQVTQRTFTDPYFGMEMNVKF